LIATKAKRLPDDVAIFEDTRTLTINGVPAKKKSNDEGVETENSSKSGRNRSIEEVLAMTLSEHSAEIKV